MTIDKSILEVDSRALAHQRETGVSRRQALREIIDTVQARVMDMDGHTGPHPFPLTHEFADGIYKRTIYSPAGTLVVGMIHRHAHFCVITKGDVSVLTEDGPKRVQAPYMFRSPAGSKRMVYHHTDTEWTTFHATNETDIERIEQQIIAPDYESLDEHLLAVGAL